ncbi:hypothetical protein GGX14DRAFT_624945 [Mycena pura]|uniref:Uncharacterized protein n=1 Tax=Mycena pura TaxID=153505 RepID=A0AAD6YAV1_9AGAR|nr:hypothetical protein GGX14DRAFT_624945 [Mycena pura]
MPSVAVGLWHITVMCTQLIRSSKLGTELGLKSVGPRSECKSECLKHPNVTEIHLDAAPRCKLRFNVGPDLLHAPFAVWACQAAHEEPQRPQPRVREHRGVEVCPVEVFQVHHAACEDDRECLERRGGAGEGREKRPIRIPVLWCGLIKADAERAVRDVGQTREVRGEALCYLPCTRMAEMGGPKVQVEGAKRRPECAEVGPDVGQLLGPDPAEPEGADGRRALGNPLENVQARVGIFHAQPDNLQATGGGGGSGSIGSIGSPSGVCASLVCTVTFLSRGSRASKAMRWCHVSRVVSWMSSSVMSWNTATNLVTKSAERFTILVYTLKGWSSKCRTSRGKSDKGNP